MQDEKRTILSAAELHLLMILAGAEHWDGFPLPGEGTDLRQAAAAAVPGLVNKGILDTDGTRYFIRPEARREAETLAGPDRIGTWQFRSGAYVSAYLKDGLCMMLIPLKRQPGYAEVFPLDPDSLPEFLAEGFGIEKEMTGRMEPFPGNRIGRIPSSVCCIYIEKMGGSIKVYAVPERSQP